MPRSQVKRWAERIWALPRPLLLAFDVDGTLAPIVDVPDAARVPAQTAGELRALAGRRGLRVALVTGRDAQGLQRLIRLPEAWRAVEHGRLILEPGMTSASDGLKPAQRKQLEGFRRWVEAELVPQGARLERKASSVGVHTRSLAHSDSAAADQLLARAEREARAQGLTPRRGRAVLEAEVVTGDKGEALRQLRRKTRAQGVLYVGDDLTDLPAIRLARAEGGIGLFVRSPERPRTPRGASGSLQAPDEVATLISHFANLLAPTPY